MNKRHMIFCAATTFLIGCGAGVGAGTDTAAQAITQSGLTFAIADASSGALDDEHCRLPAALRDQIGVGRQARLVFSSGTRLALCTVDAAAATQGDGGAARAEMNAATLRDRFILGSTATEIAGVTVHNEVPNGAAGQIAVQQTGASPSFTFTGPDVQEWRSATIPASADRAIYTAPHGIIETNVQRQVTKAIENPAGWNAAWLGMYRQSSDSTGFPQFHITSADLHGESFPGLGAMLTAGFRYAVAFHGCSNCADVNVGGGEDETFRTGLAEVLREALPSASVSVAVAGTPLAGSFAGNYVNRLANGHGIQLEQSLALRNAQASRDLVATTVRAYLDCLIEAPDSGNNPVSAAGLTVTRDVTGYTTGFCPRATVEYTSAVNLTALRGEATTCADGARVRVDLFRRRADQSYQRIGGGYRVGAVSNGACAFSNETGYVTPSAQSLAAGSFRVVVRALDAGGSAVSARAVAGS